MANLRSDSYRFLLNAPRPINGLGLGMALGNHSIGLAVLVLTTATAYGVRNAVLWVVYLFSIISLLCLSLYGLRIAHNPRKWVHDDLSAPDKTFKFVLGVVAMTVCLLALVTSMAPKRDCQ